MSGFAPPLVAQSSRPALLQDKVGDKVRCLTCERRCLLGEGDTGWCRTRQNRDGVLYTLIYGDVSSLSANPIEKKPFYHFYPGSVALTAGSWSCNFACPWCQNWDISKVAPPSKPRRFIAPADFVAMAQSLGCQGTSISFNEPTLSLEWSLEVFRLARAAGLYNTFVTNGYMTPQALDLLIEAGLDAMNVDIKGDAAAVQKYCGTDVAVVWRNCRQARQAGVHVEVTTLVIPTVNDGRGDEAPSCPPFREVRHDGASEAFAHGLGPTQGILANASPLRSIAQRLVADLGADVPWHLSAYYPAYKFAAPPTPLATLERAYAIGREAGLHYVYLGNVPGHRYENTCCPACGTLLIERHGLTVRACKVQDGRCFHCGQPIPLVGRQ
jgi:pyruvate formate lyase activating enzyme